MSDTYTKEYIEEIIVELKYHKKQSEFYKHQVLTCGVAAEHPDAKLTLRKDYMQWDSPQAERVRQLRAERDRLFALVEKLRDAISWEHDSGCVGEYGYKCKCGLHDRLVDPDYGMDKYPEAAAILKRDREAGEK